MIKCNLTENAILIAQKRYLKIDKQGVPLETVEEMFMRIAKFIAGGETDLSDKKKKSDPSSVCNPAA
jgi:ribonucleotide reductase alpha subunit